MPLIFPFKNDCYSVSLDKGFYIGYVWGAQGGICGEDNTKARGGFSNGTFMISSKRTIYVCVGGQGFSGNSPIIAPGGFNGGGSGKVGSSGMCSGGGGGASDIRLGSNYSSRVIVAGGGGGSGFYLSSNITSTGEYFGGVGGGEKGGYSLASSSARSGMGGDQTSGGKGGFHGINAQPGVLGDGGGAVAEALASAGGGGGGFYGGGGGADISGGGGGSGYISRHIINGFTYNGSESFYSPTNQIENGHPGDGYVIIIPIGKIDLSSCHNLISKHNFLFITFLNLYLSSY